MIRNQPNERRIWGTDASLTACGCNNRRTNAGSRARPAIVLKNNAIFWPSASGSAASQHLQLPRHRSLACPGVVRRALHNTSEWQATVFLEDSHSVSDQACRLSCTRYNDTFGCPMGSTHFSLDLALLCDLDTSSFFHFIILSLVTLGSLV